jgi:hypothetical protein
LMRRYCCIIGVCWGGSVDDMVNGARPDTAARCREAVS